RVELVDGRRLWFSAPNQPGTPGLRHAHTLGASVLEVQTIVRTAPLQYTLDAASGTIKERTELGAGNAGLRSYTTDFALPAPHPQALNGSGEVGERQGKWTARALVSGTYMASLSAAKDLEFRFGDAITRYRSSSPAATREFLVGSALELEAYTRVDES